MGRQREEMDGKEQCRKGRAWKGDGRDSNGKGTTQCRIERDRIVDGKDRIGDGRDRNLTERTVQDRKRQDKGQERQDWGRQRQEWDGKEKYRIGRDMI